MSRKNKGKPDVSGYEDVSAISAPYRGWARWLVPGLIVLATFGIFLPALQNEFVDWDDYSTFLTNPHYRGLGWTQLKWMWTAIYKGYYNPLSWMTLGLDYLIWGLNPVGYHLMNLLLHTMSALVVYFLTIRLLALGMPRMFNKEKAGLYVSAGFAALLFAIHPLRVESVAWASERRDVLSGLFFLLAILAYLKSCAAQGSGRPWRWHFAGSGLFFVLSLLSKTITVSLPIILMILDVYPLRRLGGGRGRYFGPAVRRVWWEKAPFFAIAIGFGLIALFGVSQVDALVGVGKHGLAARIAQSMFGIMLYLMKTLFPFGLSPMYEFPAPFNPWALPFLLSGAAVLVISISLIANRHRWPSGLTVWICYLIVLSPMSGILQHGSHMAADRYTYLPCLGWAVLGGGGLLRVWQAWQEGRMSKRFFSLIAGLAVSLIVVLGYLTWKQVHIWRNSETLWTYAVTINPKSHAAHSGLGIALGRQSKFDRAIEHFQIALSMMPKNPLTHNNIGNALKGQGRFSEAIEHYRKAIKLSPNYAEAHYNLGIALAREGNQDDANKHFQIALRIKPNLVAMYDMKDGPPPGPENLEGIIKRYQRTLKAGSGSAEVHNSLGLALHRQGKLNEAIEHYRQALQISPEYIRAHNNLGNALAVQGNFSEAIEHYRQVLRIDPDYAKAHYNLGNVFLRQGRTEEAVGHYREALRIDPDYRKARNKLDRAVNPVSP